MPQEPVPIVSDPEPVPPAAPPSDPPPAPSPAPPPAPSPAAPAAAPLPATPVDCPPPAPAPERREFDPRARLLELAAELVRTQNRRLMAEYLRLRRAM